MRIVVNAMSASVSSGPVFFNHFLPALGRHARGHEFTVLVAPWQADVRAAVPAGFRVHEARGVPRGFLGRVAWEQLVLPVLLRRWRTDVLFCWGNLVSLCAGCAKVVEVTNAHPFSRLALDWPLAERFKQRVQRWGTGLSVRRADRVIFISRDSRERIGRMLALPPAKSEVVYYGWAEFPAGPAGPPPGPADFVLTVAVLLPHRNLENLLRAFELLVERHGYPGSLVVAGPWGSARYRERVERLRAGLRHRDRVRFVGRVNHPDLASYYRHARAFVFPSVEETLGLPLQEAMGCGVAIAAADCALAPGRPECFNPFREICGDAADYFDPFDPESICASLERLLADDAYRRTLIERGARRIPAFTWDRTAERTVAIFEELVKARSGHGVDAPGLGQSGELP